MFRGLDLFVRRQMDDGICVDDCEFMRFVAN